MKQQIHNILLALALVLGLANISSALAEDYEAVRPLLRGDCQLCRVVKNRNADQAGDRLKIVRDYTGPDPVSLDIDGMDGNDRTALFWAASRGHAEVVSILLAWEPTPADPNIPDNSADGGKTALDVAVDKKRTAVVEALLNSTGESAESTKQSRTNLWNHIKGNKYLNFRHDLVSKKGNLRANFTGGRAGFTNVLEYAARQAGQNAGPDVTFAILVIEILNEDSDPFDYKEACNIARTNKNDEMIEALNDLNGSSCMADDPSEQYRPTLSHNGACALCAIVTLNDPVAAANAVEYFLSLNVTGSQDQYPRPVSPTFDVNGQIDGDSALLLAAGRQGDDEGLVLNALLTAQGFSVNVDITNSVGKTPLILAVEQGAVAKINLLLDEAADPNIKSNNGDSALIIAVGRSDSDALNALLAAQGVSVDVDITNSVGKTPLMLAAEQGSAAKIQLLLDEDADPNIKRTNAPKTALAFALDGGHSGAFNALAADADTVIDDPDNIPPPLDPKLSQVLHHAHQQPRHSGFLTGLVNKRGDAENADLIYALSPSSADQDLANLLLDLLNSPPAGACELSLDEGFYDIADNRLVGCVETARDGTEQTFAYAISVTNIVLRHALRREESVDAAYESHDSMLLYAVRNSLPDMARAVLTDITTNTNVNKYPVVNERREALERTEGGKTALAYVYELTPRDRALFDELRDGGAQFRDSGITMQNTFIYASENLGAGVPTIDDLWDANGDVDNPAVPILQYIVPTAAKDGNLALLSVVLQDGADPDLAGADGKTALGWGVINKNIAVYDLLITHTASIEHGNLPGGTKTFEYARVNGDAGVKDALVSAGGTVDIRYNGENSMLIWAALNNKVSLAQALIDDGAAVDTTDPGGNTACRVAAREGYYTVGEIICGADFPVRTLNFALSLPPDAVLTTQFSANRRVSTFLAALESASNPNFAFGGSKTPLLYTAKPLTSNVQLVSALIEDGANLEISSRYYGISPLGWRANYAASDYTVNGVTHPIFRALINAGANKGSSALLNGWTPLIFVASRAKSGLAQILLSEQGDTPKADVNAVDRWGYTALMHAAVSTFPETTDETLATMAETLISLNAVVTVTANDGNTALMWAARNGYVQVAEKLLSVDPENVEFIAHVCDTQNNLGHTALEIARRSGHTEVSNRLGEFCGMAGGAAGAGGAWGATGAFDDTPLEMEAPPPPLLLPE